MVRRERLPGAAGSGWPRPAAFAGLARRALDPVSDWASARVSEESCSQTPPDAGSGRASSDGIGMELVDAEVWLAARVGNCADPVVAGTNPFPGSDRPPPGKRIPLTAGRDAAVGPTAAGENWGNSRSGGGGIGVWTHGASAAISSAGVAYRSFGSFAIIRATIADTPSGTSGLTSRTGFSSRVWCHSNFWATDLSGNGGSPVNRK